MDALGGSAIYTTVRCSARLPDGTRCHAALWRARGELLEISHGLRAGRRLTFVLPLEAAQQTTLPCVRCGARYWPATPLQARPYGPDIPISLTAARPLEEFGQVLGHNTREHQGEAA